jgi:hypothetical protein
MRTQRALTALSFLLLAGAVGCGGDDGPSTGLQGASCGTLGSFTGNATGTGASALSGCSFYTVSDEGEGDGPFFGMVLTNGSELDATPHVINFGREGGRPGPGTYNVGTDAGQILGGVFLDDGDRNFILTSGTVTITTSSADNLVGSLNVTGTEFGSSATITVTGNFSAKCAQASSTSTTFSC